MPYISSRSSTYIAIFLVCIVWWCSASALAQNPTRPDGMKKIWPQNRVDSGNTKMGERPGEKMGERPIHPVIQQIDSWNKRGAGPNSPRNGPLNTPPNSPRNGPPNTPPTPAPFLTRDKENLDILQWIDSPANYGTNNFVLQPNKKIENVKKKKPIKPPRMRRMEK